MGWERGGGGREGAGGRSGDRRGIQKASYKCGFGAPVQQQIFIPSVLWELRAAGGVGLVESFAGGLKLKGPTLRRW